VTFLPSSSKFGLKNALTATTMSQSKWMNANEKENETLKAEQLFQMKQFQRVPFRNTNHLGAMTQLNRTSLEIKDQKLTLKNMAIKNFEN
jgi:hypothetical protein